MVQRECDICLHWTYSSYIFENVNKKDQKLYKIMSLLKTSFPLPLLPKKGGVFPDQFIHS